MAISTSHRVPLLRGRIISQRDARSGLDVGGSCRVPSPSWSDQSTATGSRCDRKIKPVTLRQNQTAADKPGVIVSEGDFVVVHGRYSGTGLPRNWIAADIVRIA